MGGSVSRKLCVVLMTVVITLTVSCKRAGPGFSSPACNLPKSITLPVVLSPQELGYWCWAASGQMVMANFGESVTQCTQANEYFGHFPPDCCPSATAAANCDAGGWPTFSMHKIAFSQTQDGTALSLNQLTQQLGCRHLPVAFTWKYNGGSGHMMVAIGYNLLGPTPLIEVDDPGPPKVGGHHFFTYDEYVAAIGDHTHWKDMYNFSKQE